MRQFQILSKATHQIMPSFVVEKRGDPSNFTDKVLIMKELENMFMESLESVFKDVEVVQKISFVQWRKIEVLNLPSKISDEYRKIKSKNGYGIQHRVEFFKATETVVFSSFFRLYL